MCGRFNTNEQIAQLFCIREDFSAFTQSLHCEFQSYKIATRHSGTVDVDRITKSTLVDVVLELVEEILYTTIQLHRNNIGKTESV